MTPPAVIAGFVGFCVFFMTASLLISIYILDADGA